mmetsp:Transcript_17093/g.31922  ORF Transcript_17093/g.31922 Transcript_17093/m.31922 type:complete len:139 (-) Transcript_17093:852-1268(-)
MWVDINPSSILFLNISGIGGAFGVAKEATAEKYQGKEWRLPKMAPLGPDPDGQGGRCTLPPTPSPKSRIVLRTTSVSTFPTLSLEMAREALDLIRNATFTEPDDQTSWWYHRFVTSWAAPPPEAVEDKCTTRPDCSAN